MDVTRDTLVLLPAASKVVTNIFLRDKTISETFKNPLDTVSVSECLEK